MFPSYQLAHLTLRPQQSNKLVTTALLTTWRFKQSIILRSSLLQLPAHMLWVRISIWPMSFRRQSALQGVHSVLPTNFSTFTFPHVYPVFFLLQMVLRGIFSRNTIPPPLQRSKCGCSLSSGCFCLHSNLMVILHCTSHCYSLPWITTLEIHFNVMTSMTIQAINLGLLRQLHLYDDIQVTFVSHRQYVLSNMIQNSFGKTSNGILYHCHFSQPSSIFIHIKYLSFITTEG
jgi:hypothetical protein